MSHGSSSFKAADLNQRFKIACIQFDNLLASANSEELTELQQRFREGLKDYKQQGTLTVAFVGQYSAGKSTIISALTGRRDIHIDTDIATDTTTSYDWNGIKIIDTPGLFTDRADHDDITYAAIAKADLLVFCLTHMLFDTLTVENFKKLAYDKGYRWKIMLLVNKMSAEAGEEEQRIVSYKHSLAESLKPYDLEEFPICFIDAKDYCEGIDDNDEFLTEISRFDTFVAALNNFVKRRAALSRLDTPVRIAQGCLDEAQISFARNSDEDTAFLEVLSRLKRRINKERERLRTKTKSISLEMSSAIASEGMRLASAVGEENFETLNKQSGLNVRQHYEKTGQELERSTEMAIQSVQTEIESELQSTLTQAFVSQLNFDGQISAKEIKVQSSQEQIQGQVEWLKKIGNQVGVTLTKAATRSFAKSAGQGFLRSTDVVGSNLHQGVYAVGKFVGFKFQPWQAVGIAKNIGNAAKFAGPAIAIFAIGVDLIAMHKEHEYESKKADIRRDITSQFQAIAIDLEQQIEAQMREFETQLYGKIESKVAEANQQTESAMLASHDELKEIAAIRKNLEIIIQEIHQVAP